MTFVTLVEEESFTAAAKKLGVPVSTVSRTLSRLESDLDLQLLTRSTRGFSQTKTGKELFESVAPLLASLNSELERFTENEETPSGPLRITAPVELGATYLAQAMTRFMARYPAVAVEMHLTNELVDLAKGNFDFGLRFSAGDLKDSSLVASRLSPLTVGVFASPVYLARRGTPKEAADLQSHEWVIFTRAPKTFHLHTPEGRLEIKPKGRAQSSEILYAREMIRQGVGIGFLPLFLAQADEAAGKLVQILPKTQLPNGALWLVRPAARYVPLLTTVFRDFMVQYVRLHPLVRAG